jgi:glycosyltransferase involved in cell wall biosynthesis
VKILIISQYFWPENFRINDIAEYLSKKGYQVDILTGAPNYPDGKIFPDYQSNKKKYKFFYNCEIIRVPVYLRRDSSKINLFINYITFVLSSIIFGSFFLRKKKYDIIFTFATSPLTSALPAILFSKLKNVKSILWVLDLWPNILTELKIINNIFLYKVISLISEYIYKNTDLLLAQSLTYKNILKKKNTNTELLYAWPESINSDSSKLITNPEELKYINNNSFKIVFTGNIGEAQNFDKVLEAAKILKDENIQWIIVGSGRYLSRLKNIVFKDNINNFNFLGAKHFSSIKYYHDLADVLFISLKSGYALSGTIPGKLQTYLTSNKFILGMIDGESKTIIENTKSGICVSPNDPEGLANIILDLSKNRHKTILHNKDLVDNYLKSQFNKNDLLSNLNNFFLRLEDSYDKINMINNPKKIPFEKNFCISGLNLAFLGFYYSGKVKLYKNLFHWPDGIFKRRFYDKSIPKISGKDFLMNISLPAGIERIYVIGNLSNNSRQFLEKKFYKKVINIKIPYASIDNILQNFNIKFDDKDIVFITLPTPKQEQLAEFISKNNSTYRVICFGGAVAIASGDEISVPLLVEKIGLEFLWRLRTDTLRRLKRLFLTSFYYFLGEITLKYNKIRAVLIS